MRDPICNGKPVGEVYCNRFRISFGNEFCYFVVDLGIHFAVVVSGNRTSNFHRALHVDVLNAATTAKDAAKDGPLNSVAKVGENQITFDSSEFIFQCIGITVTSGMNPHVHTVVAHRAGENEVEFIVPNQSKNRPGIRSVVIRLRMGKRCSDEHDRN